MKLSLIIPVYNESRRVRWGLQHALNYLLHQDYDWEVIVVSDGSTDATAKTVSQLIAPISQTQPSPHRPLTGKVHLVCTAHNFGKGHAIRVGVEAATGEYIVFSDIDFSVPITSLPKFFSALKQADVAIGSRRLSQSHISRHQLWWRESLGQGFTQLSNFILGLHHSDLTCGFKAFHHQIAQDLFSRQHLNGWAFDSEILFLANKLNYQVTEIPVRWHNNPFTKVHILPDLIKSFLALIYIRLNYLYL